MPKPKTTSSTATMTSATDCYEPQLWQMADALRGALRDVLLPPLISGDLRLSIPKEGVV